MNKESIFEEFARNKAKQEEKEIDLNKELKELEEKQRKDYEQVEEAELVTNEDEYKDEEIEINDEVLTSDITNEFDKYKTPEFLAFKEKFMKEENVDTFFYLLEQNRKRGVDVFDDDFYIYHKMLDSKIKVVIIEPSEDEASQGKGGKFFLVKPIYSKEYNEFVKKYGPRNSNFEAYKDFTIKKGTLYPTITQKDIDIMTGGVANSLYKTINDISDFNTVYRIMEI